jgi:hypothetical protein
MGRPEQNVPVELMQTTRMASFNAPKPPAPQPAAAPPPAAPKAPDTPLMSDDAFAHLAKPKPAAPPFDPMKTQKMGATDVQTTQRMDAAPGPETTQKIPKLDPAFKPEATQKIDPNPPTVPLEGSTYSEAETTQRIDDSIWRLQEAKRILKGITPK